MTLNLQYYYLPGNCILIFHIVNTVLVIVLGATYQGCDLLGELAESLKTGNDSESTVDKKNTVGEWQTGDGLPKSSQTSLRRSLSLVLLSELVTPVTTCDNEISEGRVGHSAANVDGRVSAISCCGSKEQLAVDNFDHEEYSLDVSSEDSRSVTEIPPLSQRLQLNQLQSDSAVTDSVSHRKPAAEELPLSGDTAVSRKDNSKNFCLKKASHVNSDSALLPSRRRHALKLRTAIILSDDDVFLDSAKSSSVNTKQHKACSPEKILSEDTSDTVTSDCNTYQFDKLDSKLRQSVTESDIIQKFQSSLHIRDKNEDLESITRNESCHHEQCQIRETSHQSVSVDYCAATDAVASSIDTLTDESSTVSPQPFSELLIWSPRHCGNFCIDTSIINTPSMDCSDHNKNALQVRMLSVCDVNNLNNGCRTLCDLENTGIDRSAYTDEVSSNDNASGMSDLLFDDPVSPEENLVLPVNVFEDHCNISVTESGNSHCNEGDYSVIIID